MAEIKSYGFIRHLRADASSHVLLFKKARLVRSGRGASFWFFPMSASLAEVPVDDREMSLIFHGRSSDFQDVTVQGVITYRATNAEALAERVDFTIDGKKGTYLRQPLEKIELRVVSLAQQHASLYVGTTPVRTILKEGHVRIREAIEEALVADAAIAQMGLGIVSIRVSSVKPSADLEKALEAPTREKIQQESDEATFARRALAVEKERAIQENAMRTKIELARREEELIGQEGQNARREAIEKAEAERIGAEGTAARAAIESAAEANRVKELGEANAGSIRVVDGARVEVERNKMDIYRNLPPQVLLALAAQQLAGKLQRIDHLNLSPDALGSTISALMQAGTRRLERGEPKGG
jgi:regulator of protease activity HflC (stomatin/prohibitin superfamily)